MAVAQAASTPEAAESHAEITDALAAATEQKDILANTQALTAPEAAQASAALQDHLTEAVASAAEAPQAQEVQPEVVKTKIQDTHVDLEKNLLAAKRHQKQLKKYGSTMTPDQVVKHQAALQKHLELALHFAEQHDAAVQQEKAIEAGASPVEVAEITPVAVAQGRRARGSDDEILNKLLLF